MEDLCCDLVSLNMCQGITVDKILGMYWDTSSDILVFRFKFHRVNSEVLNFERHPTKRELLSMIMSIFDPFGLLANFTIHAKLMIQEVWTLGIDWDDPISEPIFVKWN